MSQTIVANRWYPEYKGASRSYKSTYPTPQSILRRSVGVEEYKFICKTVTSEHIRAACVLPRGIPYAHLTNTPWSLVYTTPDWVMVIVSTAEQYKWIDLCKASGAVSWQRGHSMTYIYEWTEPDRDEHGLEIKPHNAMGATGPAKEHPLKNKPRKGYDRAALVEDLRAQLMTADDIAMKYDVSPQTIYTIIRREGIVSFATRKDLGKPRKQYDREALVADIRSNQMTYAELGKKYDLRPISVQRIARVEGLTKPRQSRKPKL